MLAVRSLATILALASLALAAADTASAKLTRVTKRAAVEAVAVEAEPEADLAPAEGTTVEEPIGEEGAVVGEPEAETLLAAPPLDGTLQLSLPDAVAMGLENNLDIEVERHEPLIAAQDVSIAWGAYDPTASVNLGSLNDSQPNTFSLNAASTSNVRQTDGGAALQGLVPYVGAEIGVEFLGSKSVSNSTIQALSPEYGSSIGVSFSVPLARDLIWNNAWTQVKTSRVLSETALEEFRRALMDTVEDIETSYWALVAAGERVRVAQKSLETAQALLGQTETQYEVGTVSKVDVVESEAGVAEREFNVITEENSYRNAQDVLIDQVLGRHLTATSQLTIEPTDRPEDYVAYDTDAEISLRKALDNRPELAAAQREVERQELQLKFAKNQRLPRVDVDGSYVFNGVTGFGDPRFNTFSGMLVTPIDRGNFSKSVNKITSSRLGGHTYNIRGTISIPIGNVAARHSVSKTQLELRRAHTRLDRVEQQIVLDVRARTRNLASALEGIEAAIRRMDAETEKVRAERIRLEHGESTPFEVLQRERDLVDAETQRIFALQAYRNSEVGLHRAQGTILKARNIVVDEVRSLR